MSPFKSFRDNGAFASVGNNALFSSLSQLEFLWYNEIETVTLIEQILAKSKQPHYYFRM